MSEKTSSTGGPAGAGAPQFRSPCPYSRREPSVGGAQDFLGRDRREYVVINGNDEIDIPPTIGKMITLQSTITPNTARGSLMASSVTVVLGMRGVGCSVRWIHSGCLDEIHA